MNFKDLIKEFNRKTLEDANAWRKDYYLHLRERPYSLQETYEYVFKEGDTLFGIATKRFGLNYRKVYALNGLNEAGLLPNGEAKPFKAGDIIYLPAKNYTVKGNEGLLDVLNNCNMTSPDERELFINNNPSLGNPPVLIGGATVKVLDKKVGVVTNTGETPTTPTNNTTTDELTYDYAFKQDDKDVLSVTIKFNLDRQKVFALNGPTTDGKGRTFSTGTKLKLPAQKYKVEAGENIGAVLKKHRMNTADEQTLFSNNNNLRANQTLSTGQEVKVLDKPTRNLNVGGYTGDNPIAEINVAWTFDDGPTYGLSKEIHTFFEDRNIHAITWFFVRARFENWAIKSENKETTEHLIKMLKSWYANGNEFGIHTAELNQGNWFPGIGSTGSFHQSIDEATKALHDFYLDYFEKYKMGVVYLRPPGGLVSEILAYLRKLEVYGTDEEARKALAIKILNGTVRQSNDIKIKQVIDDVVKLAKFLKVKNSEIGFFEEKPVRNTVRKISTEPYIMVGNEKVRIFSLQDWNIVSDYQDKENRLQKEFITNVTAITEKSNNIISDYIILCHDTKKDYFDKFKEDFIEIEKLAISRNIKINYKTMSQIYDKK